MALGVIDPNTLQGINGDIQIPMPNYPMPVESALAGWRRRLGANLFPIANADSAGLNPAQVEQLQAASRRMLGLGLLTNIGTGRSFGQGLGQALQLAQGNFDNNLNQAFQLARYKQQQQRQASLDARSIDQQNIENQRADRAEARQKSRDVVSDQHFEEQQGNLAADRATQREIQREQIKSQEDIAAANRSNALNIAGLKTNAGQKPTEYDKKAKLLYGEMADAEKQLQTAGVPSRGSMVWNSALGSNPVTRVFTSDDYRKYEAAGTRWAQNFLYLKSGAQAPEQEVRRTMQQYLPQPGDSADVVAQKAAARQQAMSNVSGILNPNVGGNAPQDPLGIR